MTPAGHGALPEAFFLPTRRGRRFALFHPARGPCVRGSVLYLHPFAEELNTTRRVVAKQARALAQAGYAVLQIDLFGCGDSEGHFADGTWADWLEDARTAHAWLKDRVPAGPRWLWGMRAGALLAGELAATEPEPVHLLLWQPVASGQQMLQQFLRLHAAGQWLAGGTGAAKAATPAQALAAGEPVDIAGYRLSATLARGLSAARLQPPQGAAAGRRVVWLEVSSQPEPVPSPAAETQMAAWRAAGWRVHAQTVHGPAFWQVVGTDDAPLLTDATLAALALATGEEATP